MKITDIFTLIIVIPVVMYTRIFLKKNGIPIETVFVPVLTIIFLHNVITLPKEVVKEVRITKLICFIGLALLSVLILFNQLIFKFFEYNWIFLLVALSPGAFYSLICAFKEINITK